MLPVECPERHRCAAERKSLGTAEMPACDGAGRVRRSPRAIPVVSLHLSWLLKRMELNYAACKSMVSCWFCFSAWPLFHPACQSIGVRNRRGITVLLTGQRTLAVVLARHKSAPGRCLSLPSANAGRQKQNVSLKRVASIPWDSSPRQEEMEVPCRKNQYTSTFRL